MIIHGTYTKQERIGKVADNCPTCKGVREFEVIDHFEGTHIYFIRVGSWRYAITAKRCKSCQTELPCDKTDYATIIPLSMKQIPFENLLKETNPKLAANMQLDALDEIEQGSPPNAEVSTRVFDPDATKPKLSERLQAGDDSELQQLYFRLADFDLNDPDFFIIKEKFKYWKSLVDHQKAQLTQAVEDYCDKQVRLQQAKQFLISKATTFPKRASCSGCLVTTIALGAFCTGLCFLPRTIVVAVRQFGPLSQLDSDWYWKVPVFVLFLILMFYVHGAYAAILGV